MSPPTKIELPTCKLHESRLNEIHSMVTDIYSRLFVDNGRPCHQTRLDRNDQQLAALRWFAGVVLVAIVGIVAKLLVGG